MPAILHPPTRRRFLASVAASAGVLVVRPAAGRAADADPHRVALLSDPHIPDKPETIARDCNMTDRLRQVAAGVAKLGPRPACAVLDGDLAYKAGTAGEYAAFGKLIEPVRTADVPLYLTLGNHDHFDRFAAALSAFRPKDRPVDGKQVLVIELERANLFVLDSFDPKNAVGGKLGADQLKWLASALDARKGKPAVVLAHHPLQFAADKAGKFTGLADAADLWPVLKERPQVKAYVFGHTHTWRLAEKDGIHLINLPAIGYPFAKGEVTGWVDAHLTATGVKLELRALDAAHPKHGDTAELTWRK